MRSLFWFCTLLVKLKSTENIIGDYLLTTQHSVRDIFLQSGLSKMSFRKPLKKTFRKKQNSGSADEDDKFKSLAESRGDAQLETDVIPTSDAGVIVKDREIEPEEQFELAPSKTVSSKLSFEDVEGMCWDWMFYSKRCHNHENAGIESFIIDS